MRLTTYLLTVFIVLGITLSAAPPKRKAATSARSTVTTATKSKSRSSSGTNRARQTASRGSARYGKPVATAQRYRGQSQPTPDRYIQIQRALASRGYFHGEPDGGWGPESQQALREFQKDQNLPPTGRISSLSLIALGLGPQRDTASVASVKTPSPLP